MRKQVDVDVSVEMWTERGEREVGLTGDGIVDEQGEARQEQGGRRSTAMI